MHFLLVVTFTCSFSYVSGMSVFTTEQELNLDRYINAYLKCRDVPGISLAVVKNGNIFAKGFGFEDIENKIRASNSTIFCLGSVTKSMTAMLLARMISDGKHRLTWSSKVKDILGHEYKFPNSCITESVTLADVLSHRTGLASADLMLQAGIPAFVTREQLMKKLHYLPTLLDFRDTFFYNNLVYVLAGHVAEKLTNKTWEMLMKEEFFVPLNMTSTVFIGDNNNPTIAVPYVLDDNGKLNISDSRLYRLHPFGPSGSVCASGNDMTKWLLLITSAGRTQYVQLINKNVMKGQFRATSTLNDLWMSAYSLQPSFPASFESYGYGFGWFTSFYRGNKLLHHSGSLYGYSCIIAYLPDSDIAFTFLTNGPGEEKFHESMDPVFFYVLDTVLGYSPWLNLTTVCSYPSPWKDHRINKSSENKTPMMDNHSTENSNYCGCYKHPLYGTVNVKEMNGSMHLSYGLILTGTLKPTNNAFTLDIDLPLRSVFLSNIIVSFENMSQENKYTTLQLMSMFEKYRFTRVEENLNRGTMFSCHPAIIFLAFVYTLI